LAEHSFSARYGYGGKLEATVEFLKLFYFELGEAADCFEFEKEFIAFTLW
jgi:hypothetical protein